MAYRKDKQFYRFALYGFLKNLRFFEPFLILFFRERGFSFLEIGALFSIREIATNILEIPTGVIADIYGRRKSMVFSMLSYISSFLMFYFFPRFFIYAIAMVLFAMGEAFRTGTHKAMILEYLRINNMLDKKVEYYGGTRSWSQLGSAFNSLIAAALVFYSGSYKVVFAAAIVPYIINLINLATYPKYLEGEGAGKKRKRETLRDFVSMFRNLTTVKAILNTSIFNAFFKSTKEYLQPILESFALSLPILLTLSGQRRTALVVGLVYFVIYLLTSYASKNSARFSRKFSDLTVALNVTYLAGALFIIFAGLSKLYNLEILSIIFFLSLYILHNLRRPIGVSYVSETISHKAMASGLSVESQLKTLISAGLAPVIGFFADRFGVGGSLSLVGLMMLLLLFAVRVSKKVVHVAE